MIRYLCTVRKLQLGLSLDINAIGELHLCHLVIGCGVVVCVTANQERNLF